MKSAILIAALCLAEPPELADISRLPPLPAVHMALNDSRLFLCWLDSFKNAKHLTSVEWAIHQNIDRVRAEAWNLNRICSLMLIAHDATQQLDPLNKLAPDVWARRRALAEIRDLIGEAAYYGGNWPPAWPWWAIPNE